MNKKINTQPMPGFMELLPEQQILLNVLLEEIRRGYELCGFRPIETPILERSEVLLTKGGGETEKQIYRFKKGENDISLRFDLTVPLARYVSNYQNQLVFPFKVYNIGKVYRGEKPQAGRYREFYQCDIDIIGSESLDLSADADIVETISNIFTSLNLDFTIKINNRKILTGLLDSLGIELQTETLRVVDKLEKIGEEKCMEELRDLGISNEVGEKLFEIFSTCRNSFENLKGINIDNDTFRTGIEELEEVISYLKSENWEFDLTVARGLDYYTGTVYETILNTDIAFGSVCSGGRYENLTSYYTKKKYPGVGASIGLTRLFDWYLRDGGLDSDIKTTTSLLVISLEENFNDYALELVKQTRGAGINTEIMYDIKKGLKYADRLSIPFVAIIGEDEFNSGKYMLKDMRSGEQEAVDLDSILNIN